ncbi:MAG: hypothetical protein AAFV86_11980 [Pseudomonadota bacterium]
MAEKKAGTVFDLLRTLVWPVFLVAVFIRFEEPIERSIRLVPNLLASAEKVSAVGIEIQLSRAARDRGESALAVEIGELSGAAVELLLESEGGRRGIYSYTRYDDRRKKFNMPPPETLDAYEELASKGLVEVSGDLQALRDGIDARMRRIDDRSDDGRLAYELRDSRIGEDVDLPDEMRVSAGLTDRGREAKSLLIEAMVRELAAGR